MATKKRLGGDYLIYVIAAGYLDTRKTYTVEQATLAALDDVYSIIRRGYHPHVWDQWRAEAVRVLRAHYQRPQRSDKN